MARRLVEAGVRCVTIDHANWDTHDNNFHVLRQDLLPQLNAASIASVVNTNWDWMGDVVSNLSPASINALLVDIGPWMTTVLMDPATGLNEAIIAALVNHPNTVQFVSDLMPLLDESLLALILRNNIDWIGDFISQLTATDVNDLLTELSPWITGTVMPGLDRSLVAAIANDAATVDFISDLLPLLDEAALAGVVNNNTAWISDFMTQVTPAAGASITEVNFWNGDAWLASISASPYSYTWTGVPAGSYMLRVRASDNRGGVSQSTVGVVVYQVIPDTGTPGIPGTEPPVPSGEVRVFSVSGEGYLDTTRADRVEIAFVARRAGSVAIQVYTLRGALVREAAVSVQAGTRHGWSWDGRDAQGRTLPAGVYIVRVAGAGLDVRRKVVIVN